MVPCISQNEILRKTAGSSILDHKRNELTTEELTKTPTVKYLIYRINWLQQINQMERCRLSRQMLYYVPTGKWSTGRPPKRWQETLTDH